MNLMKMSSQHMAKNVYCQNKELSQHTLPLRGGHDGGGGGGGDEVWLKKTECMGGRGGGRGAGQPKGRNNCGGHRFTSGSVALFWPGGGPTSPLTIKGVSRLTGVFQRPEERKTHSQTFKTSFFFSPCACQVGDSTLQIALHFMLI